MRPTLVSYGMASGWLEELGAVEKNRITKMAGSYRGYRLTPVWQRMVVAGSANGNLRENPDGGERTGGAGST